MTSRQYNQKYCTFEGDKQIRWHRTYELNGELYYVEVPAATQRPIKWNDWQGQHLPKELLYTPLLDTYKRAHQSTECAAVCYLKRPPLARYTPEEGSNLPAICRNEIAICELLLQHPHPNILRYHGVVPDDSETYVAGLCFDRHGQDLNKAVEGGRVFSKSAKKSIMDDIKSALSHLHSLGYIHNDVNPNNILLPLVEGGVCAVLADFDSCVPVNTRASHKRGTDGFYQWTELCTERNDWFGWEKTAEFLDAAPDGELHVRLIC
ncbi:hypothetical protein EMMF5_004054 [Cystobasidiomycetes sp. EMM_F5]